VKKGQTLRGYRITTMPTNRGAGNCMWAVAERDGGKYFVKEYTELKRPQPDSMGSREQKELMLAKCDEFERRQWAVIERIDPKHSDAGNLVTAVEFFREGSRYYKITDLLDVAALDEPHELSALQKRVLLTTLADSLRLLHGLGIVHGDLKPQNVLLHQPDGSDLYTAKLIDFDDAYVAGAPPPPGDIRGDAFYGAPEWVRWVQGDRTVRQADLHTAVDMFAVGLMIHTYLVGELPGFDGHGTPAEAVIAGAALALDPRLPAPTQSLVGALTVADPHKRPLIDDVLDLVVDEGNLVLGAPTVVRPALPSAGRKRVRSSFGQVVAEATPISPPISSPSPPSSARRSRLRINIDGRELR
jgi:eukaryotic-like serine/threonine-protein kinase